MGATKLQGKQLIDNTRVAVVTLRAIESTIVAVGEKTYTRTVIPYSGTIVGWYIITEANTNATLDLWKAAGAIPTNANSITASAKPAITGAQYIASTTLTGWTTAVASGDVITLEVEANTVATQIGIFLKILKD